MSKQFLMPLSTHKACLRRICLNINPNMALVDEIISITVTGLRPVQRVTVQALLKQGENEFRSNAHFLADQKGHIDVSQHVSFGGTYTGVEKMGLFWSLKPVPGVSMKKGIMNTDMMRPLDFTVSVIDDHIPFDDLQMTTTVMMVTGELKRWYKHPTVRRIVVHEGRFPGVIDMSGSAGGLVEYRVALLASRGFACFALTYFRYDDLPTAIGDIDLDYILVKALVNICGLPFYTFDDLKKSGQVFWKGTGWNFSKLNYTDDGFIARDGAHIALKSFRWDLSKMNYTDEGVTARGGACYGAEVIPAWKNNAHILYIHGEDDAVWRADEAKRFIETCPEENKKNIEFLSYPGAGHRIEPPYMPMYRTLYHPLFDLKLLMGGHPVPHAAAEEDAWKRLLHEHLPH